MKRVVFIYIFSFIGLFLSCKGKEGREAEKVGDVKMICIVPVGKIDNKILSFLCPKLKEVYNMEVEIKEGLDLPNYAYNPERKQYLSTAILNKIKGTKLVQCEKILGIADVDLYVPSLNFVFGEADLSGKACVISVTRLRQEYYDLPKNEKLFEQRILKEAVHELGHTFGLSHCPDIKGVMHFSNRLSDTDIKSHTFCPSCRSALGGLGIDK